MANCYNFKLLALDGTMIGSIIDAGDIFLPLYVDVILWQVITGGNKGEVLSSFNAQIRYNGYIGSCPPLCNTFKINSFCLIINSNKLIIN